MPTARTLLDRAMRTPMQDAGWTPKAAGWFIREVRAGQLAVVATGMATQHAGPGEGQATAHVGLRLAAVEEVASALCGTKDGGYKQRTAVMGLGYATPARRWQDWPVSEATVDAVAAEVTGAVGRYGWPHIQALVEDADALVAEVGRGSGSALDLARRVVLLSHLGRIEEAANTLRDATAELVNRTDAAAMLSRQVSQRLKAWLIADRG